MLVELVFLLNSVFHVGYVKNILYKIQEQECHCLFEYTCALPRAEVCLDGLLNALDAGTFGFILYFTTLAIINMVTMTTIKKKKNNN